MEQSAVTTRGFRSDDELFSGDKCEPLPSMRNERAVVGCCCWLVGVVGCGLWLLVVFVFELSRKAQRKKKVQVITVRYRLSS